MSTRDEYADYAEYADDAEYIEDTLEDGDLSRLEAGPGPVGEEGEAESPAAVVDVMDSPDAAIPIYRLRLKFSCESFLGAYTGDPLAPGDMVLVSTRFGRSKEQVLDLAQVLGRQNPQCCRGGRKIARIERPATSEELRRAESHRDWERRAFDICKERISAYGLEMKLVSVHYILSEPKIVVSFTAEKMVDFRELIRDLSATLRARIEMVQIGVRDEPRITGGFGICGRPYCCRTILDRLQSVNVKTAKLQNLSINSMKISGPCDKLLCCIAYEDQFYAEQQHSIPPRGCRIGHNGVTWKVKEVNAITGKVQMEAEDGREVSVLKDAFEKSDGHWTLKKGTAL
ncbi:MAG: hypothetical protein LBR16_08340 [Treponema sp.]|jgi:cell fate regulator YaaT (PSP1 superfamily)|nr:hypothetical protein [Treponema sp.]